MLKSGLLIANQIREFCYSYDLDYKNCKNSTNEIIDRIRSKINVNPYKLKTFIGC